MSLYAPSKLPLPLRGEAEYCKRSGGPFARRTGAHDSRAPRAGRKVGGKDKYPGFPHQAEWSKGFTLIEVAVVMLVIVIVLGIVSVNLNPDRETPVRDEARRMVLLLQTARQEAILQGRILAIAIERQGYYFLMLNDKNEFKPMAEDEILRARSLPSGIVISTVDIEGLPENEKPRLILLPTGELPPFTVIFSQGEIRWQVEGTLTGEISAQTALPPVKA